MYFGKQWLLVCWFNRNIHGVCPKRNSSPALVANASPASETINVYWWRLRVFPFHKGRFQPLPLTLFLRGRGNLETWGRLKNWGHSSDSAIFGYRLAVIQPLGLIARVNRASCVACRVSSSLHLPLCIVPLAISGIRTELEFSFSPFCSAHGRFCMQPVSFFFAKRVPYTRHQAGRQAGG